MVVANTQRIAVNWNQMMYPLTSEYYRAYSGTNTSESFSDGIATGTWLKEAKGYNTSLVLNERYRDSITLGDVLYCSHMINPSKDNYVWGVEFAGGVTLDLIKCKANEWTRLSAITTAIRSGAYPMYMHNCRSGDATLGMTCQVKSPIYINLTKMFGAGKEPKKVKEFEQLCVLNNIDLTQPLPYDSGTQKTWIIYCKNISLINIRRNMLMNTPHLETVQSGNTPDSTQIAHFKTDLSLPLKECTVTFEPECEGSGTPSPSNVRKIKSGYTSLLLTQNNISEALIADSIFGKSLSEFTNWETVGSYKMQTFTTLDTHVYITVEDNDVSVDASDLYFGFVYNKTYPNTSENGYVWIIEKGIVKRNTNIQNYPSNNPRICKHMMMYSKTDDGISRLLQRFTITIDTPYSGNIDILSGEMNVGWIKRHLNGDEDWFVNTYSGTNSRAYTIINAPRGMTNRQIISDKIEYSTGAYPPPLYCGKINENGVFMMGIPTTLTTAEDVSAWVKSIGGIDIIYPLDTPLTYHLEPHQISACIGVNEIAPNIGTVEIQYWTH